MRRVIEWRAADVLPSDEDVLCRLDTPPNAEISPRIREVLAEGASRITRAARPRGVLVPVSESEFSAIYHGEGKNAPDSPLRQIVPRAEALALFVGTIGEAAEQEIHALFAPNGDPAIAVVLDAFASEMTNRVAAMLAEAFCAGLTTATADTRVLPYSPGYCGWHVSGQRALFAAVKPDDIGVSLATSCLMQPLKSVSGVAVVGNRNTHRFRPQWTFCNECKTRDCRPRMASVR